jgi:phosphoribosylglycinamide formyltransferase 1
VNRRLGVLISGRGSNLQAIIDAVGSGRLDATIAVVISNRKDAAGLARAKAAGVEAICLNSRDYSDRDAYDGAIVDVLRERHVGLV